MVWKKIKLEPNSITSLVTHRAEETKFVGILVIVNSVVITNR